MSTGEPGERAPIDPFDPLGVRDFDGLVHGGIGNSAIRVNTRPSSEIDGKGCLRPARGFALEILAR